MKILKTGSFFQPNNTSTNAQIHEAKITPKGHGCCGSHLGIVS